MVVLLVTLSLQLMVVSSVRMILETPDETKNTPSLVATIEEHDPVSKQDVSQDAFTARFLPVATTLAGILGSRHA